MNSHARRAAIDLQKRYQIGRPTLEDVVSIISEQGYEIIDFEPESKAIAVLSSELSLTPQILSQNAFVYSNGNVRLVFIRSTLTVEEKLYALAHELAHIALRHLQTGRASSVTEEYEANEFVHYLMNPGPAQVTRAFLLRHRKAAIAVACAVILAVAGIGYMEH